MQTGQKLRWTHRSRGQSDDAMAGRRQESKEAGIQKLDKTRMSLFRSL